MELLPISFLAGILTILAPCILPILPIIIGGALSESGTKMKNNILRPIVIVTSLGLSIIVFTLILKATTALITVPDAFWQWFSASIILIFALTLLFPNTWSKLQNLISFGNQLTKKANQSLATHSKDQSLLGAFFIGIALGPVFASCSPTYFLILGTVLPASFSVGLLNLFAYALGLAIVLLLIAFAGQKVMDKFKIAADPQGWFKKGLGILFILVAIAILTGFDKKIATIVLEKGYGVTTIEQSLLQDYTDKQQVLEHQENYGRVIY